MAEARRGQRDCTSCGHSQYWDENERLWKHFENNHEACPTYPAGFMKVNVPESCGTCNFSMHGSRMYCRRYPPTVGFNEAGYVAVHSPQFPHILITDWCGEWQVKR